MAVSGIAASPPTQQIAPQPPAHHRRGGGQPPAISDVDAQSSSVASTGRSNGPVGGKVNISA
jgi:hypothetical protein